MMKIRNRNGLLLIVLVGILTLLMMLAVFFVTMMRFERSHAVSQADSIRAKLLARSGLEYALARLMDQTSPSEAPEEDWRYRDDPSVPVERALNPSYHAGEPWDDKTTGNGRYDPGADGWDKSTQDLTGNGRYDGWSGRLRGTYEPYSDRFSLRIDDANSRIHINGGSLTAEDANENGIPDHRDAEVMRETSGRPHPAVGDWTEDGPNGFLVRLLDNLERIATGTDTPTLGKEIIEHRPEGGYRSLDELKPLLHLGAPTSRRHLLSFLTLHAWVDPKVIKPQPVNSRPHRWMDIDDAHRKDGGRLFETWNRIEGDVEYDISWKRDYLYAHRQLRLDDVVLQPRAPIAFHTTAHEVLAAQMTGLSGMYLHVWEGNLGFDGGFGFYNFFGPTHSYDYPKQETTESPWIRTRVDYGSPYGTPSRPWYGLPEGYDPDQASYNYTNRGRSLVWPGPLGELREMTPLKPEQAKQAALRLQQAEAGTPVPLSGRRIAPTWPDFRNAVQNLPLDEDVNADGFLDGVKGDLDGEGGNEYMSVNGPHTIFELEDWNENGELDCEEFPGTEVLGPTPQQMDLLCAMANPNTDLNDFNPDINLWKWVDKSDVLNHTMELTLGEMGLYETVSAGIVEASKGKDRGLSKASLMFDLFSIRRDTTQADFLRDWVSGARELSELYSGDVSVYQMSAGRSLVSHPEPEQVDFTRTSVYDGQITLAGIAPFHGPLEVFYTADFYPESGIQRDLRGPDRAPLVGSDPVGNYYPDGVYSEKDATPGYDLTATEWPSKDFVTNTAMGTADLYFSIWAKSSWFPQSATRPHSLLSLAFADPPSGFGRYQGLGARFDTKIPVGDIPFSPIGCFFVPARNNLREVVTYPHNETSSRGTGWPTRALLWGMPHRFVFTDKPVHNYRFSYPDVSRLEKGKWFHVGMTATPDMVINGETGVKVLGKWVGTSSDDSTSSHDALRPERASAFRLGERASVPNMNYCADITFGSLVCGISFRMAHTNTVTNELGLNVVKAASPENVYFRETATLGRYYKEPEAFYRSSDIEIRARTSGTVQWTAISMEEERNTEVSIEIWKQNFQDGSSDRLIGRYEDPAAENAFYLEPGTYHYRVIFRNRWDPVTRLNTPLNETPFLDDVTLRFVREDGPRVIDYREESEN